MPRLPVPRLPLGGSLGTPKILSTGARLHLGPIHLHVKNWECRALKSSAWCQKFGVPYRFFSAGKWGFKLNLWLRFDTFLHVGFASFHDVKMSRVNHRILCFHCHVCSKTLLNSSTLRQYLSAIGSYMLHIPNSAEGNCLREKENHTLCRKSEIKSINLRITKI